ncbi:MAG: bifunctional diguanylate cyclase/phosphodiesterase [Desulfovibrio sp.]|nr:bifunctional diguanylate cyclase/phosphodiesterase [Desulfovibrio sp.]
MNYCQDCIKELSFPQHQSPSHSTTFVFAIGGNGAPFCAPGIKDHFPGNYQGRNIFDVWEEEEIIHTNDRPSFKKLLERLKRGSAYEEGQIRLRTTENSYTLCDYTLTLSSCDGRYIGTLTLLAISPSSDSCLQCRDLLTGTLAPRAFFKFINALLAKKSTFSVIRINVGALKPINQKEGFEAGDRLLQRTARLLRCSINTRQEACSRMGGESFGLCLKGNIEKAVSFARSLLELTTSQQRRGRYDLSIGICMTDGKTPGHILYEWASLAQKSVLKSKDFRLKVYDGRIRARHEEEIYVEANMVQALENGEFLIYLQPKVDILTGLVVGAEALTRWRHKDRFIMPDLFIPIFEDNGFVCRLDAYIWEKTARLLRTWIDQGLSPCPVSVNASRLNFVRSTVFECFQSLINRFSLPKDLLEIEITETGLVPSQDVLTREMRNLHASGFSLSMDDFGIGYSSLKTVQELPFTTVKLDKSFVKQEDDFRGHIVAQTTIALARKLGLRIVAEGVETTEEAEFLLRNDCRIAQGFLYAKPMPADEFSTRFLMQKERFPVYVTRQLTSDTDICQPPLITGCKTILSG